MGKVAGKGKASYILENTVRMGQEWHEWLHYGHVHPSIALLLKASYVSDAS